MPTYQYRCTGCKHEFDELQSIKDEPLKTCPKCKKKKLNRLIGTGAGLLFRGSGFYSTDYRSESYKSAAKADNAASDSGRDSAKGDGGKKAESKTSTGEKSGSSKGGKVGSAGATGKTD